VGKCFSKEIDKWCEILIKDIVLHNISLSEKEIIFIVEDIINRLIFLRICESKGAKFSKNLSILLDKKDIYERLIVIFQEVDKFYNLSLFCPDAFISKVKIGDEPIKYIISMLYYPSPYEFSLLSSDTIDLLGIIHECFLGKVIRLTPEHRAKVEGNPEAKKAGGVYYTPKYIVDYIVNQTVVKLIESKTPDEISKIHILDPACGSGVFLINAYRKLLEYHCDWYLNNDKNSSKIYQTENAVKLTKLNLLLCLLEYTQLELCNEQILPNLDGNIKCGNSLIGSDFYSMQQIDFFDESK
jgi:type I restriction-modification system DNA methylase subunit